MHDVRIAAFLSLFFPTETSDSDVRACFHRAVGASVTVRRAMLDGRERLWCRIQRAESGTVDATNVLKQLAIDLTACRADIHAAIRIHRDMAPVLGVACYCHGHKPVVRFDPQLAQWVAEAGGSLDVDLVLL
jgi:hypothetical protein